MPVVAQGLKRTCDFFEHACNSGFARKVSVDVPNSGAEFDAQVLVDASHFYPWASSFAFGQESLAIDLYRVAHVLDSVVSTTINSATLDILYIVLGVSHFEDTAIDIAVAERICSHIHTIAFHGRTLPYDVAW